MIRLSENFTLEEFIVSETAARRGLDNTPPPEIVEALKDTAKALEEVRSLLGQPITTLSGYRSVKVNSAVGGAKDSQHCTGEAVDFISPRFGSPREICHAILDSTIAFDQLIEEGQWAHISFSEAMRHQALTAHFGNGKTTYTNGIA